MSVVLQTGKNQEECTQYQKTSHLMTHLQNQIAQSWTSSVFSYCLERIQQEQHINKWLFSHFTHSFAILAVWINGTTEENGGRRRRKKGSCLRGGWEIVFVADPPSMFCHDKLPEKESLENFLFASSTGSWITKYTEKYNSIGQKEWRIRPCSAYNDSGLEEVKVTATEETKIVTHTVDRHTHFSDSDIEHTV